MWLLVKGLKECIRVVACHAQLKEGELSLVRSVGQCLLPKVSSTLDFRAFLPFAGGLLRLLDHLALPRMALL